MDGYGRVMDVVGSTLGEDERKKKKKERRREREGRCAALLHPSSRSRKIGRMKAPVRLRDNLAHFSRATLKQDKNLTYHRSSRGNVIFRLSLMQRFAFRSYIIAIIVNTVNFTIVQLVSDDRRSSNMPQYTIALIIPQRGICRDL